MGVMSVVLLNAQITTYTQDFEVNPMLMPSDITLMNVDGMQPASGQEPGYADSAWIVRPSNGMGSKIAVANSWHEGDAGDANDWMIMPTVTIATTDALVSWDAMSLTSSGEYPDDYMVIAVLAPDTEQADTVDYVLTNGVPLQEVTAEAFEAPVHYEVLLSDKGFNIGDEIWVVFRLKTPAPGGSELGIDNIVVGEPVGIGHTASSDFEVYPNPVTNNKFYVNGRFAENASVQIFDITGKMVFETGLVSNNAIDIQNVTAGVYICRITSGNQVATSRLIVE